VPHARMGEIAVEYLLGRAAGERAAGSVTSRIACDYVARESVAAPRRRAPRAEAGTRRRVRAELPLEAGK